MISHDYEGRDPIFRLLDKAEAGPWKRAAAFIVLRGSEHVATVRVAYPADGAGRLRVFVWSDDAEGKANRIQAGSATGYGYDKLSAAMHGMTIAGVRLDCNGTGGQWRQLREAGFTVIQAL